ncbi:MAG TPA: hypothetical protein VEI74_07800 [Candidatus Methylomirabilis sp.]|nr:hypothetical protein [Candidatus Methylomirabilis sp.]
MSRHPSSRTLILALGLALSAVGPQTGQASQTIKKCQDATGRWHYGDTAAEECAKSKITVMNNEGITKKVIAAPPTEQELKEREANKEVQETAQKKAEEQAKKDTLLLSSYGVENDITYVRDRKIAQIEAFIKASEQTLTPMRAALARMEAQVADESKSGKVDEIAVKNIELTKAQITRHEAAIADKRKEQDAIRVEYDQDLARYRELKKQQQSRAPAAAAKK